MSSCPILDTAYGDDRGSDKVEYSMQTNSGYLQLRGDSEHWAPRSLHFQASTVYPNRKESDIFISSSANIRRLPWLPLPSQQVLCTVLLAKNTYTRKERLRSTSALSRQSPLRYYRHTCFNLLIENDETRAIAEMSSAVNALITLFWLTV
jgi:hypothetical protein